MKSYEEAINETLIEILASLRKEQGYTLETLADLAGVHRTTIGLLERGERNPTLILALQLSRALGTPLWTLLQQAEAIVEKSSVVTHIKATVSTQRDAKEENFHNEDRLYALIGLRLEHIRQAILTCYNTLDTIDRQLVLSGSLPISQLVELANLSSMIGNLLSGAIAEKSDGLYQRNRPHAYPDLVPIREPGVALELKVALETNKPKGHLVKPGVYLTFRYVLGTANGQYQRKKKNRGNTVWIWECRVGRLYEQDFSFSNTEGDSGKTAVIKTASLETMHLLYFVPELNPYARKSPGTSH